MERPDYMAGNPERQRLAAERAAAIMAGKLPEFERRQKDGDTKEGALPMDSESIAARNERLRNGAPEAAFLREAARRKLFHPEDQRSVQDIAKALMEGESAES